MFKDDLSELGRSRELVQDLIKECEPSIRPDYIQWGTQKAQKFYVDTLQTLVVEDQSAATDQEISNEETVTAG